MALSPRDRLLLRMSTATNKVLGNFREAINLTTVTGHSINELRDQVCADRLELAGQFLTAGDKLLRARHAEYRSAISRYYYAMYHAMRTVVYFVADGDDHEKHEILPSRTPADFPDSSLWANHLKGARSYRNEADYDPYPADPAEFKVTAKQLRDLAHDLLPLVRSYLRSKGCAKV